MVEPAPRWMGPTFAIAIWLPLVVWLCSLRTEIQAALAVLGH